MGNTPIMMGDLILTEVLQGFQSDKDFATAGEALGTKNDSYMIN